MARTIQEIYDVMIAEKQTMAELNALQPNIDSSQTLLTDLTSASRVAIWRLLFFVVAVAIWTNEKLFDELKAWIEVRLSEQRIGNLKWYQKKALEFQYGDALVIINDSYQYTSINPSNQIVKLASVNEVGGQVLVKVANLSSGTPVPLSVPELQAFQNYLNKIKVAGVLVNALSRNADSLKIHYKIYYDPLVLTPTGELISNPGTFPVEDAINNYCKGLDFDGVFVTTLLTDKIQKAIGVINPVFQTGEVKYGSNPYTVLGDKYNPNAGYLEVDPAYPLSTTITYIQA